MQKFNLETIYANIDQMLLRSLTEQETAIEAYSEASEIYSQLHADYRKSRADVVKRLKKEGAKIGTIKELTDGETAEIKGQMLKAEGKMKACKMYVDLFTERVNAVKFIGRKTDTLVK